MWYRVLPWLFIFHSSLDRWIASGSISGNMDEVEKHPLDLNDCYKAAKVEDLGSFSFVLLSVFAEFGGHALERKQFAMDIDKICFTVRKNLHWNTLPARLCRPCSWRPSCKKPWDTGPALTDSLTWNRRIDSRFSECLPSWVTMWFFESEWLIWGNSLDTNLLEGFT